jgi:hypothetical protein
LFFSNYLAKDGMAQAQEIASQFVTFYYATFDKNRSDLLPLYRDVSMLSFEGKDWNWAGIACGNLVF